MFFYERKLLNIFLHNLISFQKLIFNVDYLHVKEQMGHKRIEHTLIYIHLVRFSDEEFVSTVAKTVDEARKLVEAEFTQCHQRYAARSRRKLNTSQGGVTLFFGQCRTVLPADFVYTIIIQNS
jgi:hypothetical protein